uniref:SSD domain-containing protein n=1 Tax=Toxocara canis TaxID=6265 RepID=A0A183V5Z7_TOXCA
LCSAHPAACLSISIVTIVLLSYPAAIRFKLPASSPMDVHWNEKHYVDKEERAPEWLYLKPSVYLQQIIVRVKVEPWNIYSLSPMLPSEGAELLPSHGCLLLSPTLFWHNNEQEFYRDDDILQTIFSPLCTPSMCAREMLLGMPTRMTGIKRRYRTNRHRSIDYAVTLFFPKYEHDYIASLRTALSEEYELQKSKAADDSTFVHVFYRPRKYFADYFPLITSYILLMLYIYFSVSKIVMVKSKWGLALAAVITVATALTMTAGICAHIEMMPSLWGAELFPYLALVVGLENTLCLTRSVVYTPPTMDVRSRVSHGLSQEGYSFTKYFLLEMSFLAVGYISFVPEIQEFCTFAFIGLFVDFYMQLFFYVPCLTFDLLRLSRADKEQFSLMLFNSDIRQYKAYPSLTCPVMRFCPRFFVNKMKRHRVKSDSELKMDEKRDEKVSTARTHRRTISAQQITSVRTSTRLRLLYFWTRTRFVQRAMMVLFVAWTIWLGFIVHKWRLADAFSSNVSGNSTSVNSGNEESAKPSQERFGVSHRVLESAPLQWGEWTRSTFNWWPVLFAEYNLSLSGHYITFLPPIVLKTTLPQNDPSIVFSGNGSNKYVDNEERMKSGKDASKSSVHESKESLLNSRIYSLETQMTAVLIMSAVFLFSSVTLFILYTCFPGRLHGEKSTHSWQEVGPFFSCVYCA